MIVDGFLLTPNIVGTSYWAILLTTHVWLQPCWQQEQV